MRPFLSLILLALTLPEAALCWWSSGHQVVARIAAAHLTPAARTRIARILEVPDTPESVADALAAASTWADETKAQTRTGIWHFIDLTLQDEKQDIPKRCPDGNCAPARISVFAAELRSHQQDQRWSELDQLRYVVHLVGDVHQPLHDISDADQGGNCERLYPPVGQAANLHALWDGGILQQMDLDIPSLTASLQQDVVAMTPLEQERWAAGTPNDWVWEGHELAIRDIYRKLHIPEEPNRLPKSCADAPADIQNFKPQVDMGYVDAMKPVVREQLIKAGLRLARLLNDSL